MFAEGTSMSDLELLSLIVFLYENRASTAEASQQLKEASAMLQKSGHVHLDVDTCTPVHIGGACTPDLDMVITVLNKYRPLVNLHIHAAKEEGMQSISRLHARTFGRYSYTKGFAAAMPFPRMHGGELFCDGDVQLQTIVGSVLISDYSALMTSFCVISGNILSCTEACLDELCSTLRRRIQLSSDEHSFGFLLVGGSDHMLKYTREDFVRAWRITCTASKGKLRLQAMHALR
ncbi:unnamed protein product [Ectocarpus sp. 8 AP-2014]